MNFLARVWVFLVFIGLGAVVGGVVGIRNRLSENEPTSVTWAQLLQSPPDKKWLFIADAPLVDARTVHVVRTKKFGTAEDAYVAAVSDPADPTSPVKVFVLVHEDADAAPFVAAGTPPVVRRGPIEGRRIDLSNETRALLGRQGAPVASDMICLRAGPPPTLAFAVGATVIGLGLMALGWKARQHRARARAVESTQDA
jgi:hypothetical protein